MEYSSCRHSVEMKSPHITNIITRFSDLDSQRHVNNASYLAYALQGQFSLLENSGYTIDYLANHKIFLKPEVVHVSFLRQQLSQTRLEVNTTVSRVHNSIYWDQKIINFETKELAVHMTTLLSVDQNYFEKIGEISEDVPESLIAWNIQGDFSGHCRRSSMDYHVRHIDLDAFNQCANPVLWRINEEARWCFLKDVDLPLKFLMQNDTALFWINGVYYYYDDVQLYDNLKVYTWISKYDKARIYIRQEIMKNNNQRVLLTEGEFLSVSLSRGKPKRTPDFIKSAIMPFVEEIQ